MDQSAANVLALIADLYGQLTAAHAEVQRLAAENTALKAAQDAPAD